LLAPILLRFLYLGRLNEWTGVEDPDMYRGIAEWLVEGYSFARPDTGHPTAYRPPLYSLLLTFCPLPLVDNRKLANLHFALGLATLGFVWLTAAKLLDSTRPSNLRNGQQPVPLSKAWIAPPTVLAVMLTAIDPLLINSSILIMTETLATCLASIVVWQVSRGLATAAQSVCAGVTFGLSCLCRPTFWAFGMVVAVVWCARQVLPRDPAANSNQPSPPAPLPQGEREAGNSSAGCEVGSPSNPNAAVRPWMMAICVCIGTGITVAPWAIRNSMVFGRPIVTTTHGGYTLLLGHNPVYSHEVVEQPWGTVWSGNSLTAWQASLETAMQADGVPRFDEVSRDRWMYRQAWRNIANDPALALRAGVTLLGRFWGVVPLNTPERSLPTWLRWGIGLFYVVEFVAMGLGLWKLTRTEWSRWWPLVALIVSFTLVHSLYWADMRMRAPLVPAIALLAARGLSGKRQGPSAEVRR
jgi:hypothetical protein